MCDSDLIETDEPSISPAVHLGRETIRTYDPVKALLTAVIMQAIVDLNDPEARDWHRHSARSFLYGTGFALLLSEIGINCSSGQCLRALVRRRIIPATEGIC